MNTEKTKKITLQNLAKKNKWKYMNGKFYCSCGEEITFCILLIANREFGICNKCKDVAISRNLIYKEWYSQNIYPSLLELLSI